ncbi:hypothetical protein DEM27_31495 [Metarhizobium album]|uniref:DUF4158 domain-containing protein n=1 Tax=Metarhizobium album TaxID=2182425 RepID=A0A2U2DGC2_9HYPH|nr:hypothetical protein DEM27_31495 [Rhizobium album]
MRPKSPERSAGANRPVIRNTSVSNAFTSRAVPTRCYGAHTPRCVSANFRKLFDIPVDEDSFIRHYLLSSADRLEIELRRRNHNRLGFAIQLCLMRYPGRMLGAVSVVE